MASRRTYQSNKFAFSDVTAEIFTEKFLSPITECGGSKMMLVDIEEIMVCLCDLFPNMTREEMADGLRDLKATVPADFNQNLLTALSDPAFAQQVCELLPTVISEV